MAKNPLDLIKSNPNSINAQGTKPQFSKSNVRINQPYRDAFRGNVAPKSKEAPLTTNTDITDDQIKQWVGEYRKDPSKILTRSDLVSQFGDRDNYDDLVDSYYSVTTKYPESYRGPVKADTYYLNKDQNVNDIFNEETRRYRPKWLDKIEGLNPDFDWRKYGGYYNDEGKIIPGLEDAIFEENEDYLPEDQLYMSDVYSFRDDMVDDDEIAEYFTDDDWDLTRERENAVDHVSKELGISKDRVRKYLYGGESSYGKYADRVFGAAPDLISDPGTQGIMAQLTSTPDGNKALLSSIAHIKRLYPYLDDKQILSAAIDDLSQEYENLYQSNLTSQEFQDLWNQEDDDWEDAVERIRARDPRVADILSNIGGFEDWEENGVFYGITPYGGRDDWEERTAPFFRFAAPVKGTRTGQQNNEEGILKYFGRKDNPPKSVYGTEYGAAIDNGKSWKDQIRIAKELVKSGKLNESAAIGYLTSYTNFDDKMKKILLDEWGK